MRQRQGFRSEHVVHVPLLTCTAHRRVPGTAPTFADSVRRVESSAVCPALIAPIFMQSLRWTR